MPGFSANSFGLFHEDIAIIKVNEPYEFTPSVSPICVPHKFMYTSFDENALKVSKIVLETEIKTVHFMGAGEIDEEEGTPLTLQHAELKIISPKKCLDELDKGLYGGKHDEEFWGYLLLMQFLFQINFFYYMHCSMHFNLGLDKKVLKIL